VPRNVDYVMEVVAIFSQGREDKMHMKMEFSFLFREVEFKVIALFIYIVD
jgi:hypothetical protein